MLMPNFVQLDAIDQAILEILSADARIPNNRLAEQVGLAPSTCLARVRTLRTPAWSAASMPRSTSAPSAGRSRR
jgi:hypothetical protein